MTNSQHHLSGRAFIALIAAPAITVLRADGELVACQAMELQALATALGTDHFALYMALVAKGQHRVKIITDADGNIMAAIELVLQ